MLLDIVVVIRHSSLPILPTFTVCSIVHGHGHAMQRCLPNSGNIGWAIYSTLSHSTMRIRTHVTWFTIIGYSRLVSVQYSSCMFYMASDIVRTMFRHMIMLDSGVKGPPYEYGPQRCSLKPYVPREEETIVAFLDRTTSYASNSIIFIYVRFWVAWPIFHNQKLPLVSTPFICVDFNAKPTDHI